MHIAILHIYPQIPTPMHMSSSVSILVCGRGVFPRRAFLRLGDLLDFNNVSLGQFQDLLLQRLSVCGVCV